MAWTGDGISRGPISSSPISAGVLPAGGVSTPSQLGFLAPPVFLAPHAPAVNTNQPFVYNPPAAANITPSQFWLVPTLDLQRHVPTIYTAQAFVGNPTIGPPRPGWYTQAPDLLNHPKTLDTNQPFVNTAGIVAPPNLIYSSGEVGLGSVTSFTTGSFTAPSNCLLVAFVNLATPGASASYSSVTATGGGLTWTPQVSTGTVAGLIIFTAPVTTGASMSLSVANLPGNTGVYYDVEVYSLTSYNTSTPVGATGSVFNNSAGAVSFSLSQSPAASSIILAGKSTGLFSGTGTGVAGVGWASLYNVGNTHLSIQQEWITGTTSATVSWQTALNSGTVNSQRFAAIEILAPGSITPTTSDCSFLYQPNALLNHPATLDTNQPLNDTFAGWAKPLTPTSFGFFTQAPDLFRHPPHLDTNQSRLVSQVGATPAQLGFWRQPDDLLRHPATLDTRQPFEFLPPAAVLTTADCSFLFQPNALLNHPVTLDTNQPRDNFFAGWAKLTPTALGWWVQAPDLFRHPPHLDTNQPRLVSQAGATPTQFGFFVQAPDLLRHPVPFILGMQPFSMPLPPAPTANKFIRVYFFD